MPNIFYLKKFNSCLLGTLCVWPEHISYILPKADLVIVQKAVSDQQYGHASANNLKKA